jgi:acyl carrier protein
VRLDTAALRARAKGGMLPPIARGLVRGAVGRARDASDSLERRLAGVPEGDRGAVVLEFVRGHVAEVLGHASADAVDAERAFKELGFDSLTAVELRNRLVQETGLKLPTTLVFDRPSPAALAEYLRQQVGGQASAPIDEHFGRLEAILDSLPADGDEREHVTVRLQALAAKLKPNGREGDGPTATAESIRSATGDELFELIDTQLGSS